MTYAWDGQVHRAGQGSRRRHAGGVGQGNPRRRPPSASVRSQLTGEGDSTHVNVRTNLNVTGKPPQFGRGVMAEVGGKLIGIFADNLASMLAAEPAGGADGAAGDADAEHDQDTGVPADAAAASGRGAAHRRAEPADQGLEQPAPGRRADTRRPGPGAPPTSCSRSRTSARPRSRRSPSGWPTAAWPWPSRPRAPRPRGAAARPAGNDESRPGAVLPGRGRVRERERRRARRLRGRAARAGALAAAGRGHRSAGRRWPAGAQTGGAGGGRVGRADPGVFRPAPSSGPARARSSCRVKPGIWLSLAAANFGQRFSNYFP